MIADALADIRRRIERAEKKAGRAPGSVTLVAVGKTFPVRLLEEACQAGQRVFGENYAQEGVEKSRELKSLYPDVAFHFIGHLQRNKARLVAEHFDLVQSVDRESLITELSRAAAQLGKQLPILLQVNISGETSKGGCAPDELQALAERVLQEPTLKLKGLMSIGSSRAEGEERVRAEFQRMADLRGRLEQAIALELPLLSMGMSDDFEIAIEYGASVVRVGSAVFGLRTYQS